MPTSLNVSTSWEAPPPSWFNSHDLANCAVATEWAAAAVESASTKDEEADIPMSLTIAYLRAILPQNLTVVPSDSALATFFIDVLSVMEQDGREDYSALLGAMASLPLYECGTQICPKLNWEGDSDVSGIGMMISYYLAAVFATTYFVVLATTDLGLVKSRWIESLATTRFVDGFRESANVFLDTALVFAVAMLGAAVVRYAKFVRDPTDDFSVYGLFGSVYMSAFSIFPAIVIQSVAEGLRGRFIRQFMWFAVIGLAITVDVMYREVLEGRITEFGAGTPDDQPRMLFNHASPREWIWLQVCEPGRPRYLIRKTLTAGHVVLAVNVLWWIYYFVASILPHRPKSETKRIKGGGFWKRCRPWLRLVDGVVCIALMWLFLVLLHRYRAAVGQWANGSNEDSSWTFGQVLSLATWSPVLIDLCAIFLFGPQAGLGERISRRYKVVTSEQPDEERGSKEAMQYESIGHDSSCDQRDREQ